VQGYPGSERSVYRYLATLKRAEIQAPVNLERIKKYTPKAAVWLFVRDPKTLNEIEQEDLATILRASPPLKRAYELIQSFLTMVHKREGKR
jgi:transposase